MAAKITTSFSQAGFSDPVRLKGYINLSISGTFTGTLTVQRSRRKIIWLDVEEITEPVEAVGYEPEYMFYRVGVKEGGISSGEINVVLGLEDR